MTTSLRDKARAAAAPRAEAEQQTLLPTTDSSTDQPAGPLEPIEYTGPIAIAEAVPVAVAFGRVMADVQTVKKDDSRNDPGGRYNFRGVDRVINAVGPALRRHGVLVLPVRVFDVQYREARTSKGTVMEDCTLKVEWMVVGPMGDVLPGTLQSTGQANDTGDKATSKATSVAQRTLFLSALHIPTEDPTIDHGLDRGEVPVPSPAAYRDEIVNPKTAPARLLAIRGELRRHELGGAIVMNEVGDDENLWDLSGRIGRERSAGDPS